MSKTRIQFSKLEAQGNDFALIDARQQAFQPAPGQIVALGDRRRGIGFDQLLILRPPRQGKSLCLVDIYNNDGSPARQCGNGMRAIALWLHRHEELSGQASLETAGGHVGLHYQSSDQIRVTLAIPDFRPSAWGYRGENQDEWLDMLDNTRIRLHGVSMGNPHVVIPWDTRPGAAILERLGRRYSDHEQLEDGANVNLARIVDRQHIELAVFERGAGPTPACGSGACATAAMMISAGLVDSPVTVIQPGGRLVIHWPAGDQPVEMTGPARLVFDGQIELEAEVQI